MSMPRTTKNIIKFLGEIDRRLEYRKRLGVTELEEVSFDGKWLSVTQKNHLGEIKKEEYRFSLDSSDDGFYLTPKENSIGMDALYDAAEFIRDFLPIWHDDDEYDEDEIYDIDDIKIRDEDIDKSPLVASYRRYKKI